MKKFIYSFFIICAVLIQPLSAQVLLDADGPNGMDTYTLITSVLAPNHNPIEVPDCGHTGFGDHIDEIFDTDLNTNVFRFYIHVNEDDDRCINVDRQRNEIKTYDKSPDNLLGVAGEVVEYKWKFKLNAGFQSSSSFTHIHQLKAVGGSESAMPLITLTTRKATPDKLQLRYAETTSQVTLAETALSPFIDEWVEVIERVTYGEMGAYEIEINQVSNGTNLFSYTDTDIRMWKTDADFVRPKWGIYRSLNNATDLRDEEVLFANFSIEEIAALPVEWISFTAKNIDNTIQLDWQTAEEFNNTGFEIQRSKDLRNDWEILDFIPANSNSSDLNNYQFSDREPFVGTNYYRLKQIDLDGTYQFSDTVAANYRPTNGEIQFFPNPAKNKLTLTDITEDVFVEIYTTNGQKVKEGFTEQFQFDISTLTSGTFLVHIHQDEGIVKKLVKL